MHSIPTFIKESVDGDNLPYVVAFHYKLDPDAVRKWDNEAIAKAYYALIKLGVVRTN